MPSVHLGVAEIMSDISCIPPTAEFAMSFPRNRLGRQSLVTQTENGLPACSHLVSRLCYPNRLIQSPSLNGANVLTSFDHAITVNEKV
jgi:hypothetical protein